jgi:hypothetical protein
MSEVYYDLICYPVMLTALSPPIRYFHIQIDK